MDKVGNLVDVTDVVVTPELLRDLARSKIMLIEMQSLVERYQKELDELNRLVFKSNFSI